MQRLGVLFDRSLNARILPSFVQSIDAMAIDDVWFVEDISWHGSFVQASSALAVSASVRVGVGLASVSLRNPVLYAMEVATLAALHPGRFIAGIGHGNSARLSQVIPHFGGARSARLEENVVAVRELLAGKEVNLNGEFVSIERVQLAHPPEGAVPVYVGAVKPKSLALSGRLADGTILAEGTTPALLRKNLQHIQTGLGARDGTGQHEIVVYAHLLVHQDASFIAQVTQPIIEKFAAMHDIAPTSELVVAGSPHLVADRIEALWEAGADSVVLRPLGANPLQQVELTIAALSRN